MPDADSKYKLGKPQSSPMSLMTTRTTVYRRHGPQTKSKPQAQVTLQHRKSNQMDSDIVNPKPHHLQFIFYNRIRIIIIIANILKWLSCEKHFSKHFLCIILFIPNNTIVIGRDYWPCFTDEEMKAQSGYPVCQKVTQLVQWYNQD